MQKKGLIEKTSLHMIDTGEKRKKKKKRERRRFFGVHQLSNETN